MDLTNAQSTNIFAFATEQARTIVQLHYATLAVCTLIAMTVIGLLSFIIVKFRHQDGNPDPEQYEGNLKYELTWTLIPTAIVLGLGIATAVVMHTINPPVGNNQPDVIVIAHQWWWEYRYPKKGVVVANELYLPEGVNTLLEMRSADVVHSFWVPAFGEKMDTIPGHPNHIFYKPLKPGLFVGACAEFCGADHALMRILVNVVPPKEYDAWLENQKKVPDAPTDETAQRGKELFLSKTCVQCHSVAGTTAQALVAPDLTHLATRQTIGAGVLPNTVDNVAAWISNAQDFKPGCHMPNMRVSKEEAHAIAVYLEGLK